MWQAGQVVGEAGWGCRMLGITAKSALGVTFRPQEQGVCGPALSWELQEPRAGDTRVCVSWLTTYWRVFCPPHLAGLAYFPRPPCVPGTLQSSVHSICFCPQHWDGYIADEEREAQRGAEAYPRLHSSDKARTCVWGLGHCPMLPCRRSERLSAGTRGPKVQPQSGQLTSQGLAGRREL